MIRPRFKFAWLCNSGFKNRRKTWMNLKGFAEEYNAPVKVLDQILRSTLSYQHSTQPNYSGLSFSTHCSYGLLVGLSLQLRSETYYCTRRHIGHMYNRNVCYALFDSRGALHPLMSNSNCTWHNSHLLDHTLSNQSPEITLIETKSSKRSVNVCH